MTATHRLYHDLAHLWPLLSPPSDYATEAELVADVVREYLGDGRHRLLELGAGGGHALHHLREGFACTAVDLSPEMLALCRELNPDVPTHVGDMRDIRLDEAFDVVLIHDAVDYMTTRRDAAAAVATAAAHLRPGGLAIVAPTYTLETFVPHEHSSDQLETDRGPVTYLSYVHDADPDDAAFELVMVFLVPDGAGGVRVEEDRHPCGLFDEPTWLALLQDAGLDAEMLQTEAEGENADVEPRPWSLFVGLKR